MAATSTWTHLQSLVQISRTIPLAAFNSQRQRLANLLRCCSNNSLLDIGIQVHGSVLKMGFGSDTTLATHLVNMYSKCGSVEDACQVFEKMPERTVVSWTALMCGFLQNGNAKESLILFAEMGLSDVKPNEFTLSTNLKACGMVKDVVLGMQIHGSCVRTGFDVLVVVGNAIIDMYSKCESVNEAAQMFEMMPSRNLISWNSMVAGYCNAGRGEKALVVFRGLGDDGEVPDEFTFTSALKACSLLGGYRVGTQIHGFLIASGFPYLVINAPVACAIIDLYVKCGKLLEARKVFFQIEQEHFRPWSGLILGYAQEEKLGEAMVLFRQLRERSVRVDNFVLSSMLAIFADFALVEQGKQMHAYSIKVPSAFDISVSNSVLDMYLKCGLKDEAERYFTKMPKKGVISWTVMITGYAKHGLGEEACRSFDEMLLENTEPDDVAYLAVLLACSHSGLVEEGQKYFWKLCNDHKVVARVEHYACMVDLLGRAGHLKEAKKLIDGMPMKPNAGIWQALLGACRVHGDLHLAREVGDILLRLDGNNPVNYVMISNIYAKAGYWEESERVREQAKAKQLKKEAGRSWLEVDKEVHIFYGGDDTHPLTNDIREVLVKMEKRMLEELGYVSEVQCALHDIEEESKAESLRFHSEKLAIGLALVRGGWEEKGRVIRVFKNLRVCGDCHEFIKGLSKIVKVVFLVRDANRFHRFEDGQCSCRDYW